MAIHIYVHPDRTVVNLLEKISATLDRIELLQQPDDQSAAAARLHSIAERLSAKTETLKSALNEGEKENGD